MKCGLSGNVGKKELLRKYRKAFRIPENLNYYSKEDFKSAERQFIKYAILNGIKGDGNTPARSRSVTKH